MFSVSYLQMVLFISVLWVMARVIACIRSKGFSLRREAELLLVYVCLVVVVRFTFFPFGKVDGQIQPLLFDSEKIFPLWLNLTPFVYLFDYPSMRDALLNLIGNIAMFIPLGIVWPVVFRKLDHHGKVIGAGAGASLCIEILQLPFYGRASDIDDLILNTVGFMLGYGILLGIRILRKGRKTV